jgi:uncharacterized protein involved in outer membrane biogenesis
MRLKVPFLRFAFAGMAFLLPSVVLAAVLPFLINAQPVRAKLLREIGSWTGAEAKIAGAISIKDFFSLSVEARDVEIDRFKGIEAIEGMKAQRVVARIAWFNLLAGRFEFDKIKVYDAVIRMRGGGVRDLGVVAADLLSGPRGTPFDAINLDNGLIAMRIAERKPYRRLVVKNALARTTRSGQQLAISAELVWKDQPLTLATRSAFHAPGDDRMPLRVQLASGLLTGHFDGEARLVGEIEAEGAFGLQSPDLAAASNWLELGIDPAVLEPSGGVTGALTLGKDQIALGGGEIVLAGQTVQAELALKRTAGLPRLEGVLAFDRLDLTALIASRLAEPTASAPARIGELVETDLRVSAKILAWNGREAGPAALVVTSTPGRLAAEIAELVFLGGEVRGRIALDGEGAGRRMAARLSAENVEAGDLLRLGKQRDWLGGKVDMNIEADAAWNAPAPMEEAISVRARVNFPDGGQMHLDIPGLARSAMPEGAAWGGVMFTDAAFERLRFDLTYRAGQIGFANVALGAASFQVNGRGEIDLPRQSLDWGLTFQPRSPAVRDDGAEASDMDGTPPSQLSIKGPWASPTIRANSASSGLAPSAKPHSAAALELSASGR